MMASCARKLFSEDEEPRETAVSISPLRSPRKAKVSCGDNLEAHAAWSSTRSPCSPAVRSCLSSVSPAKKIRPLYATTATRHSPRKMQRSCHSEDPTAVSSLCTASDSKQHVDWGARENHVQLREVEIVLRRVSVDFGEESDRADGESRRTSPRKCSAPTPTQTDTKTPTASESKRNESGPESGQSIVENTVDRRQLSNADNRVSSGGDLLTPLPNNAVGVGQFLNDGAVEKSESCLCGFSACHFVRCHGSSSTAAADTGTMVADCQWEPDGGGRLAACGGRAVCLLDISGSNGACRLIKRFTDESAQQQFVALAWSRLVLDMETRRRISVLAVAGRSAVVSLLHPDCLTRYCRFSIASGRRSATITCLAFHSAASRSSWLFCGGDCGVSLWDIGVPTAAAYGDYSGVKPRELLQVSSERRSVISLLVGEHHLLAGTDTELFVWPLHWHDHNNNERGETVSACEVSADAPAGFDTSDEEGSVYGLAWLDDGRRVAVAFSALNAIVVWRLDALIADSLEDPFAAPHLILPIGSSLQSGLLGVRRKKRPAVVMPGLSSYRDNSGADWLVCGDNGGVIHTWRVPPTAESPADCRHIELCWPKRLVDDNLSSTGKLLPRGETVALGRVIMGSDGRYHHIASCSDVNLLCVWRCNGPCVT